MASNDEWTHVGRGKKSARPKQPVPRAGNRHDKTLTVEQIRADFAAKTKTWQQSSCRKQYYQRLDQNQPDGGWSITRALCLASGSFSRDLLEPRNRSMLQFAAFVDTVHHLEKVSETKILMLVQDPVYTATDKEFFSSLGVRVLDMRSKVDAFDPVQDDAVSKSHDRNREAWNKMAHWEEGDSPVSERPDMVPEMDADIKHPRSEESSAGPAVEYLTAETMVFELFMEMNYAWMRAALRSDVQLYGLVCFKSRFDRSYPVTKHYTATGKKKSNHKETYYGDDEEDARDIARFNENYRTFDLPVFEEDPIVFHNLATHIRQPVDEDEQDEST